MHVLSHGQVPEQHILASFTLSMPSMLLGRLTREFDVLVPVKASESQRWMEGCVLMRGSLDGVPTPATHTRVSMSAVEKARDQRSTDP